MVSGILLCLAEDSMVPIPFLSSSEVIVVSFITLGGFFALLPFISGQRIFRFALDS